MGILPQHVPTLGVLQAGWTTVYNSSGSQTKIFVSSGSYAVNADGSVMIAAEEALTEADIDMDAARKELAKAQSAASSGSDQDKAEAQITVEVLEAMLK